ncbi:MAG: 4Fe-4S ferredoxin [Candidatus Nezhaarchaeota archaeon]|nr:4Fe-4S ferredoxin [Candidatus Nezhaarchaeota archaeon]MCX8141770.1 4Fe-4S ferredoxin [Candidatus Nezhaarchaeota archaeon]MDW8050452.1 4Fe-4S ferredoxin [Nitrososphaerota archaeon]
MSVTSSQLKSKDLLIYSSCLQTENPEIFEEIARGKVALGICMSEEHLDKVGFKLATIMYYSSPRSITVLTMDGSPHCTQLHAIVEQAKRITQSNTEIAHLVVEKGAIVEVSSQAVYLSRHLSQIEKMIKPQDSKKNL